MKKFTSKILALVVSLAAIPVQGFAEEESTVLPETVLYAADFTDRISDLALENDYVKQTSEGNAPSEVTFDGNKGISVPGDYWPVRTINVAFKTPISTGVHKVSFDFSPNTDATITATDANIGINMTNTSTGNRLIRYFKDRIIFAGKYDSWFDASDAAKTTVSNLEGTKKYTLDIILDFGVSGTSDDKSMYYLNGELVHTLKASLGTMNSFNIPLSGYWDYFDNLKISTLNNNSTYTFESETSMATGYADVVFPGAMNVSEGTFMIDGEEAKSVEWVSVNKVRVYSDKLLSGGSHTILAQEVVDIFGVAPQETQITVTTTEAPAETVLYEADFTNMESNLSLENDYVTQTAVKNGLSEAVFERNKGISVPGHYSPVRTINVAFKTPISTGVHKVSFDFSPNTDATITATDANIGINMTNTSTGNRLIRYFKDRIIFAGKYDSWFDASDTAKTTISDLDASKKYTLDIILDFGASGTDDDKSMYYLNGELVHTLKAPLKTMSSFNIPLSGYWDYFDNLKISTLNDDSLYYPIAKPQNFATGYIDVEFPTAINAEDAVFVIDDVEISSSQVEWKAVDKVRLTEDALKLGGTHTIAVSGITDVYGVTPVSNVATFKTVSLEQGIEEVLYENTFDSGWSSVEWTNWKDFGEYEGLTVNKYNVLLPVHAEYEGNVGLAGKSGDWPTATQFSFDFTKKGKMQGVNSGIYKFSWDLSLGGNTNSCDDNYGGVNMKNTWDSSNKLWKLRASTFQMLADTTVTETFDANKVYAFDIIIDFDNDKVYFYLDGALKGVKTGYTATMNSFDINFCQCIDYFDNLKVTKINESSFGVEKLNAVVGNDYIDIYTTELAATDISADKVTINGVPAKAVEVFAIAGTIDNNTRYIIRAKMDNSVQANTNYTVVLSNDAKNVVGKSINVQSTEASVMSEKIAMTSVEISDGELKAVIVNNEDSKISPVVVVASYDGENRMTTVRIFTNYKVDNAEVTEIEAGKTAVLSQDISDLTGTVKGFILKDWATLMPMANYAWAEM